MEEQFQFYVFQIDAEHNAPLWWNSGGRELWEEAQKRAGNHHWDATTALAVPSDDPFKTFQRFGTIPGWIDEEPLIVTEIKADTPAEAVQKMLGLGVTRANLTAKDDEDDKQKGQ